ncbi:MAG: hypothetical protein CMI96_04495 [Pelagibacteraceae bacterium]|nr:hypothetical protein [Pelagibacteraceae bacterium]|tara:strand:+ start:24340 stop:25281 length:942 start_codon:yes stop_codon:yes gene_type:complete
MTTFSYKKILIIKHGSLGDIITATSVIKAIRDKFKNANLSIVTAERYNDFFKTSKLIDNIIIDNRNGFLITLKFISKLIFNKFDLVIDLQNSNRTAFYAFFFKLLSKSKINGTNYFCDFRYKYSYKNPPSVIQGLSNQVNLIDIKVNQKPYLGWLTNENSYHNKIKHKNFFIINPGCSLKNLKKKWSPSNFAFICNFLIKKKILPVIIGTIEDKESIDVIVNIEPRALNLIGKSPLSFVYTLGKKALGALSNDTGPAHLIAATGCKIHLLLSKYSNPKTVIPQSSNVSYTISNNINDISTNKIIDQINKIIIK